MRVVLANNLTNRIGRPGGGWYGNSLNYPEGIWQRFHLSSGTVVKPVIIFVPSATYEAIFDFNYVATKTVECEWPRQFSLTLASALARPMIANSACLNEKGTPGDLHTRVVRTLLLGQI